MKNPILRRLFLFLAIMGPGIITSNVDNDAGGITTYSVAGAALGYKILWVFLPMIVALVIIQEMCTRMGAVTGKGPGRPDPGALRGQDHLLCHVGPAPGQPGQYRV